LKQTNYYYLTVWITLLLAYPAFALEENSTQLPLNCIALTDGFHDGQLQISVNKEKKKQALILIKSDIDATLWLITPELLSAPLATQLLPEQWSALVPGKETINFTCIESTPGSEQHVNCATAITACTYKNANIDKNTDSFYWLAENRGLLYLLAVITASNNAKAD